MRTAFRIVVSLTSLAVIVQVGLAGYGAFHAVNLADDGKATKHAVENGFDPHGIVGTIVIALMVVLVLVSLAAGRVHARTVTIPSWWSCRRIMPLPMRRRSSEQLRRPSR